MAATRATDMFEAGLERREANFQPLTPLAFLERAASTFPERTAVVHGRARIAYADLHARSRRLASRLAARGIGRGDAVSVLLPNVPAMVEAHFGVPMAGAVLHSINTRLDPAAIAFQLDHCETKLVIVDRALAPVMEEALALASARPPVVTADDPEHDGPEKAIGEDYATWLEAGDPDFAPLLPQDEWDAISLNYTSGTTGDPKGVVYHHRGAALMAYANAVTGQMGRHPVYLWTLPMFHCNGWCFPWTLPLLAGTQVCLRAVRAGPIFEAIADERVTHLCGAPVVMSTLLSAADDERRGFDHEVRFMTAAAPPPESVLAGMADAGFAVTHLYGLTETYGPAVVNEWHEEWDGLSAAERAARQARQGVRYPALEALSVRDPETMEPVDPDGETLGEVMFRGNIVMKGYLKNSAATEKALGQGWFRSGDLGVLHPDGAIQLKDRSKDIIISGGENVSSIEVEDAIYRHPAVAAAAVVARPDEKWGEHPCAFVELKAGKSLTAEELIAHCRANLAAYKVPKTVLFEEIPKTSTGKVQKFALRERARALRDPGSRA